MIELIAAMFVLAVALPAVTYMLSVGLTVDADVANTATAYFLGNSLMNEISERRFWQSPLLPGNTPYAGNINGLDRRGFTNVSDYNIFKTTWGPVSPPRDETGAVMPNYAMYAQNVTVVNVAPPGTAGQARSLVAVSDGSTDFKLVTVTVTWKRSKFTLEKIFARP